MEYIIGFTCGIAVAIMAVRWERKLRIEQEQINKQLKKDLEVWKTYEKQIIKELQDDRK